MREGAVWRKDETGSLREPISFKEVRRGSSQIRELLHRGLWGRAESDMTEAT